MIANHPREFMGGTLLICGLSTLLGMALRPLVNLETQEQGQGDQADSANQNDSAIAETEWSPLKIWLFIKRTYFKWSEDHAPALGAALSYYTLLSLAPLSLIVIAIAGRRPKVKSWGKLSYIRPSNGFVREEFVNHREEEGDDSKGYEKIDHMQEIFGAWEKMFQRIGASITSLFLPSASSSSACILGKAMWVSPMELPGPSWSF